MTESTKTYLCLQCNRNAVRIVARIADRHVRDAVCAYCSFRLQVSGIVEVEDERPEPKPPAGVHWTKRGVDLARTPLNTECTACDHELRSHDFSHPSVRCLEPGCSCWAFQDDEPVA